METENLDSRTYAMAHINPWTKSFNTKLEKLHSHGMRREALPRARCFKAWLKARVTYLHYDNKNIWTAVK